jgi:hypothetical protein
MLAFVFYWECTVLEITRLVDSPAVVKCPLCFARAQSVAFPIILIMKFAAPVNPLGQSYFLGCPATAVLIILCFHFVPPAAFGFGLSTVHFPLAVACLKKAAPCPHRLAFGI